MRYVAIDCGAYEYIAIDERWERKSGNKESGEQKNVESEGREESAIICKEFLKHPKSTFSWWRMDYSEKKRVSLHEPKSSV